MKLKNLRLLPLLLIAFQACNMVNPKETIPTYIQIDSVHLESTVPAIHGTVSQKITDVWVYYNRQLLGAYQLPAKVPVITNGRGELEIIGGIWDDGLSGVRAKYPFYTVDTFSFDASPANIIKYTPTFHYRTADSESTNYFVEDFEQGNSFERLNGDTTFVKTNIPEDVFEGIWSSKLELSDTVSFGECITVQEFTLPAGRMCYLELNYKSDIPFVLRTQIKKFGVTTNVDLTGINPTTKWNKIYFNFGGFPNAFQPATFRFLLDAKLLDGVTHGKILIDNFKIINFK